ncbi:MAG: hypothetical protein JWL75_790 [Parcubacteria group bacterium]|nr:hypothetical protein [Parcubacteria group bacterium]
MNSTTTTSGYQSPFETPLYTVSTPADFSSVLTIAFFVIFFAWLAYTVIAVYHWFRYNHRSWITVPAVAVHILVSGFLIFYIASGV